MAAASGGSNTQSNRLTELHRLYDSICSAESASRRRNERLLERVAETEARASALARQTERLRSLVRQTSAVSGNVPCRLGELIRREKMVAVTEPIWTASFAHSFAIDETISPKSESTNELFSFVPGNSKSSKLTTEMISRTLTANAGTQTVDVSPPPADISSELITEGSAWWKEQQTTAVSDASDVVVKVTPDRRSLPAFDEADSSIGQDLADTTPDGLDGSLPDFIQSSDGRSIPEAPPDGRDLSPAADSEAILNNIPKIATAPISTKLMTNVAMSLGEDSSSDEEEYDPFFNFDFVKKKIPVLQKMDETVFIPRSAEADAKPLDDGPGHAPSEISAGDQDDLSDFFDD